MGADVLATLRARANAINIYYVEPHQFGPQTVRVNTIIDGLGFINDICYQ